MPCRITVWKAKDRTGQPIPGTARVIDIQELFSRGWHFLIENKLKDCYLVRPLRTHRIGILRWVDINDITPEVMRYMTYRGEVIPWSPDLKET